ncbi:phytanoyl-CoA dioxygenase family protein [Streptomyces sp. AJS327]|uniref:phytanoyl-CoA dioxygenase family protein n=1 Tax=Streptomyces sp. AJS327 TaxID=2545265 RepID=UPI0015DE2A2D|nr:phytanoyl-CoA dioxygenase family protein [Streptomyces sp. AJS327]MBA0052801.1 phytanoyl-CoA dioxygenase family protein [Streptomyces sp. AJS327]
MSIDQDRISEGGGLPVNSIDDLRTDLAGRHRATTSSGHGVDPAVADADLAVLMRDGYVILERIISEEQCEEVRAGVEPLLGRTGRNVFEGHRTQRVYSLMDKTRVADGLVDHPRVLALLDRILDPNYLLSQLQVINLLPGESTQFPHRDDGMYPLAQPRPVLSAATIWAIDEFTEPNGATVVYPDSHHWPEDRTPGPDDTVTQAVMPPGSCVFFLGNLWHGGGPNQTDASRLALTTQYCQPWLRPQETFTLSTSFDTARGVSEDIRRMLGYSIHPPFIGMVNGMHPKRVLENS